MKHPSKAHTADEVGHNRSEIVDHLRRARGCHWPISLAVIDQQGQMVLLTLKTYEAGVIVHDHSVVGDLELALCPSMPPARSWRWNLQRSMVSPR
jgi:hypothetical protein